MLPWQQPVAAWAQTVPAAPAADTVVSGIDLAKPRKALDDLDAKLAEVNTALRRQKLVTAEEEVLGAALKELKGQYEAALSTYTKAYEAAGTAAKAALKPFTVPSDGQLLVTAYVEKDLAGIRVDMAKLTLGVAALSKPAADIPAGDWGAVEKAATDVPASRSAISSRLTTAKGVTNLGKQQSEFTTTVLEIDRLFKNVNGSNIDVNALLAQKPQTATAEAATDLTKQVAAGLGADASRLQPQLRSVNAKLAGYLRSGRQEDLSAAIDEIDRLYDAAGVTDKTKRADLFQLIGQKAQAQAQTATTNATTNAQTTVGNRPNVDYTAVPKKKSDLQIDAPAVPTEALPVPAAPTSGFLDGLAGDARTAFDAATGAVSNQLGVFAANSTALSDGLLRKAADLKAEDAALRQASTTNAGLLAAEYADIEKQVVDLVLNAPDRSLEPVPGAANAKAAYDRKWDAAAKKVLSDLKKLDDKLETKAKSMLGVTGSGQWGWTEAVIATSTPKPLVLSSDLAGLEAGRKRAKKLIDLVRALIAQGETGGVDLTKWPDAERKNLLFADGRLDKSDLGAYGNAVVAQTELDAKRQEQMRSVLASFGKLKLTGDMAQDEANLNAFFDRADNVAAFAADNVPFALAEWARVRAWERDNAARKAAGQPELPRPPGLPSHDEAYGKIVAAKRLERVNALRSGSTQRGVAELHESYYNLNRAAYVAFGCDPKALTAAEHRKDALLQQGYDMVCSLAESQSGKCSANAETVITPDAAASTETAGEETSSEPEAVDEAALQTPGIDAAGRKRFCAAFLKSAGQPSSYTNARFQAQRRLTDSIKPYLDRLDFAKATARVDAYTASMNKALRNMSPALKAQLQAQGVDVDGLLRFGDRGQVLQWAAVVRTLGTAGGDEGWKKFRDGLIERFYGPDAGAVTGKQAEDLRTATASGDPVAVGRVLDDVRTPAFVTSGFIKALPDLMASGRAPRSSRDRSLLFAWNGGAKKGQPPSDQTIAGVLLAASKKFEDAAAKPENAAGAAEFKRLAAQMKAVSSDPSDPEAVAESLRALGINVWDARALRVGKDTTAVSENPTTPEEKRDSYTARALAAEFLQPGEDYRTPAGAQKIRDGIAAKLGEFAKKLEDSRRDQLILSANDEYQDRVAKLGDVAAGLAGPNLDRDYAALARGRLTGSASYRELVALAGSTKGYRDATLNLFNVTETLASTSAGRSSMQMPTLLAQAKAQSQIALRAGWTPDGMAFSGWMVGMNGVGEVVRERKHEVPSTGGVAIGEAIGGNLVNGLVPGADVPKTNLPKGPLDGLRYKDARGQTVFTSLDGKYTETRAPTQAPYKLVEYNPATQKYEPKVYQGAVLMRGRTVDDKGKPIDQDVYSEGGRRFVVAHKLEVRDGRQYDTYVREYIPDGKMTVSKPVETVFISQRVGNRTAITTIDRVVGGPVFTSEVLKVKSQYEGSVDFLEIDRANKSQTIRHGSTQMNFTLNDQATGLADNRSRTTYSIDAKGNQTMVRTEYFDLAAGTAVTETPDYGGVAGGQVTRITARKYTDTPADKDHPLAGVDLDAAILSGGASRWAADPQSTGFRVVVDRNGKTPKEISDYYWNVASRLKGELNLTTGREEEEPGADAAYQWKFVNKFQQLAAFFDGAATSPTGDGSPIKDTGVRGGASEVTFELRSGGTVSASSRGFNPETFRMEGRSSYNFNFVQLPKDAPTIEDGKPTSGLKKGDPLDDEIANTMLQQELACVRKALGGDDAGFVIFDGGADKQTTVKGFFGSSGGRLGVHSFEMIDTAGNPHNNDDGFAYITSDTLVRRFKVDGAAYSGEVEVGRGWAVSTVASKAGAWVNNSIRYSEFGREHPVFAAVVGGIAGGIVGALLDWKLLALTVVMGGANIVANALIKTASVTLQVVGKTLQIMGRVADLYFKYEMAVGAKDSVVALGKYYQTGDLNQLNQGVMGLTSAGVGLAAGHLMGKYTESVGAKFEGKMSEGLENAGFKPKGTTVEANANPAGKTEAPKTENNAPKIEGNEGVKVEKTGGSAEVRGRTEGDVRIENNGFRNEGGKTEPVKLEPVENPGGGKSTPLEPPVKPFEGPGKGEAPPVQPGGFMNRISEFFGGSKGTLDAKGTGGDLRAGGTHVEGGNNGAAALGGGGGKGLAEKGGSTAENGGGKGTGGKGVDPVTELASNVEKGGGKIETKGDPKGDTKVADVKTETPAKTEKGPVKNGGAEENGPVAQMKGKGAGETVEAAEIAGVIKPVAPEIAGAKGLGGDTLVGEGPGVGAKGGKGRGKSTEKLGVEEAEASLNPAELVKNVETPKTETTERSGDPKGKETPTKGDSVESAASLKAGEIKGSETTGSETKGVDAKPVDEATGEALTGKETKPADQVAVEEALSRKPGAEATKSDAATPEGAPAAPAKPSLLVRLIKGSDALIAKADPGLRVVREAGRFLGAAKDAFQGKVEDIGVKLPFLPKVTLRAVTRLPAMLGLGVEKVGAAIDWAGAKTSQGLAAVLRGMRLEGLAAKVAPKYDAFGVRVDANGHPVPPGFISSVFRDAGGLLQGRFMPAQPGARLKTLEEVRYSDLSERPSFKKAAADALAKPEGGVVTARFDPRTGRVEYGPKAKGSVELEVDVRPGAKGRAEITGYRVKSGEPAAVERAHMEMTSQLEGQYRVAAHQGALDDFVARKSVREQLAKNAQPDGTTFVDATYSEATGRFSPAEPGQGDFRLRFEPGQGGLRYSEVEPLKEGGVVPAAAAHNLALFGARRGVDLAQGGKATGPEPTNEELGAALAQRLQADRTRVEAENLVREELADARVDKAKAKLDKEAHNLVEGDEALAAVREAARTAVELKAKREAAQAEVDAADKALEDLGAPKKAVKSASDLLRAREDAAREFEAASAKTEKAAERLRSLSEDDPARAEAKKEFESALAEARAKSAKFRLAEETAARAGKGLTEAMMDALVRRASAESLALKMTAEAKRALLEFKKTATEARKSRGDDSLVSKETWAKIRAARALGSYEGALKARADERVILEYRRDGLHRSVGVDGRRIEMSRYLAKEGKAETGRANVGQKAGDNLCVVSAAADMAALATGKPAEGAMVEAEEAIVSLFKTRQEGLDFLAKVAQNGMPPDRIPEMMRAVAERAGLKLSEVKAEDLFTTLAAGKQVAVVLTHAADVATSFDGGPHMVNLSNWRLARNPVTGRVEAVVDVADPNVRALVGYKDGFPVYEARVVTRPVSELIPEIRGTLHGEHGPAAGYVFEPAEGPTTRGPPTDKTALAEKMDAVGGVGSALKRARVPEPAGFESRGAGKVLDPSFLPENIYTPEIMDVAREYGLVFEASRETIHQMVPEVRHNYVISRTGDGAIEMTVGRVTKGNMLEMGVKHAALGGNKEVIFAGEAKVDLATGKVVLDFNSGTYSQYGLDPRWAPTPKNAEALRVYAEKILGAKVEVRDHFKDEVIPEPAPAVASGADTAAMLARNRTMLETTADARGRPSHVDPPKEWSAKSSSLPKAELKGVLSHEGSTGLVYDGLMPGGEKVAIKVFSEPIEGPKGWGDRMKYFENELSQYGAMADALPKGWVPKLYGEVEVGGNPAFAAEKVAGKDPNSLTIDEARALGEKGIDQGMAVVELLARKGWGGNDSPQPMVLTRDQAIDGVMRKAGEVVFMDAGALSRDPGNWQSASEAAMPLAVAREVVKLAKPGDSAKTVEQLLGELPVEARTKVFERARAAMAARKGSRADALGLGPATVVGAPVPTGSVKGVGAAGRGVEQPAAYKGVRGEVVPLEQLNWRYQDPNQMVERRAKGELFELDSSNVSRLGQGTKDSIHNYVIVREADGSISMTVGRYEKDTNEFGVKHAQLASGREVLYSGEIRLDETGRPVLDFNSGTYSQYGKHPRWRPTTENARALAQHASAILGRDVAVWDHFANRNVPLDGTVAKVQGDAVVGRPVGVLSPETFRYDSPIKITAGGKTFEIISRVDMVRRLPADALKLNPAIDYFLVDAKNPMEFKGLRDGEVVQVGKDSPQRFHLPDGYAPRHFQVARVGDAFKIMDLGSYKGTSVAAAPEVAEGLELPSRAPQKVAADPVVRLELGGRGRDGGRRIEILSREEMVKRWPVLDAQLNRSVDRYIVDPTKPDQFKGLRVGEEVTLGRGQKGRFEFGLDVSRQHLLIRRTEDGYELTDLGSSNGTRVLDVEGRVNRLEPVVQPPPPAIDAPVGNPKNNAIMLGPEQLVLLGVKEMPHKQTFTVGDEPVKIELAPRGHLGGRNLEILPREEIVRRWPFMDANLNPTIDRYIVDPADPGQIKALRVGEEVILGRKQENSRFKFGPDVSGTHLSVKRTGTGYEIVDLGSSNGTKLRVASAEPKGWGPGVGAAAKSDSPRVVTRRGATRSEGWEIDGKPAKRLSGGAFKDVFVHPGDPGLVVKLYSDALSLKASDAKGLELLAAVGRAPRVVDQGSLTLETPVGKKTAGFLTTERVSGRTLADLLRDPDPVVREGALAQAKSLFADLVKARVMLPDMAALTQNVEVGRIGTGPEKAYVVSAGDARLAAKPGIVDSVLGRADPLAVHYEAMYRELARLAGRRGAATGVKGVGAADEMYDGPPDAQRERLPTDKAGPLRQLQIKLEGRGRADLFRQAEQLYHTDPLTGMPNRAFLLEKADGIIAKAEDGTVAMLDMNNFGAINAGLADVLGPAKGREVADGMLAKAGPKITAMAAEAGVTAARLGGEEIVLVGEKTKLLELAAAMKQAFPAEKVLEDAGVGAGTKEYDAIQAAMKRMNRVGSMGDFTYGVAEVNGRGYEPALKIADGGLGAAKGEGKRGSIFVEDPRTGKFAEWDAPADVRERVARIAEARPKGPAADPKQALEGLRGQLSKQEFDVFVEAKYKDVLTLTRTAGYMDLMKPEWEAAYEGKGQAAMVSARNFKQINDILHHGPGDTYLRRLGVIMRTEVNRLRKLGKDVSEPVRVGGKDFLLVGKDAAEVAASVERVFAEKLAKGEVLPLEDLARARKEAVERGMIPVQRADHLGTLRVVSERFSGGLQGTFDGVVAKLEAHKAAEETALQPGPKKDAPAAPGVGAGGKEGGFFDRLFGGSKAKAEVLPERIVWPVEAGGPPPPKLSWADLKVDGPLANVEPAHKNVLAVDLGGAKAVLKFDAKPNEARVLAAMGDVVLPDNVTIPKVLADGPTDVQAIHRLVGDAGVDWGGVKRAQAEGRHSLVTQRLPDDYVSMMDVETGARKLKAPISTKDWQGLLDAVKILGRKGLAFGDLGNTTNIRVRQVPDGLGGVRTEFALIDVGQGTLKGKGEAVASDYVQLKGELALETRLVNKGLLAGRGSLPDARLSLMAKNAVPQTAKFLEELGTAMEGATPGKRPAGPSEGKVFDSLADAAAYLNAPGGIHILARTSDGLAGDTVKVELGGKDWYVKRMTKPLGDSIDEGLRGLTAQERVANELGMREIVREFFGDVFDVAGQAVAVRHGGDLFLMTEGAAAKPDPARILEMTADQRAAYALLRLVFRAEDLNKGNILHPDDAKGKPVLIDFEKVIAEPLDPNRVAREAGNEISVKGFPVVSILYRNDPSFYKAKADALRAKFADPSFKSKMRATLVGKGWTEARADKYLSAVEKNLANFEVNLKPYIDYAAGIQAKRGGVPGVGAGAKGPDVPDFLRKQAEDPKPERKTDDAKKQTALPEYAGSAVVAAARFDKSIFDRHILRFESRTSEVKYRFRGIMVTGGGHTTKSIEAIYAAGRESINAARLDYARLVADSKKDPARFSREVRKANTILGTETPPVAEGEHWSEKPIPTIEDLPNGVRRIILPEAMFSPKAWDDMVLATRSRATYSAGGKTLYPEKWSDAVIEDAVREACITGVEKPVPEHVKSQKRIRLAKVTREGVTVLIELSVDPTGIVQSAYPAWEQPK